MRLDSSGLSGGLCVNVRAHGPDGTVFTNVPWEERGGHVIAFRDGKWVLDVRTGNSGGGRTITANEDYHYLAGDKYRHAEEGIDRRELDDPANRERNVHVSCGVVHGIAATAKRVFATVPEEDVVKVFDVGLKPVGEWRLENGGEMCLDRNGHLWIIQAGKSRVVRYSKAGRKLPQQIKLERDAVPTDLATDNKGRLMVADAGPSQGSLPANPLFLQYRFEASARRTLRSRRRCV